MSKEKMGNNVNLRVDVTYTYRVKCCNRSWELSLLAPSDASEEVKGFLKDQILPYLAALPYERREEVLQYLGFKEEDPFGIDLGEEPLTFSELKRRFALLENRAKR